MAFSIRPFRRSPVQCSVTYHAGPFQGEGTVWNLSLNGWKLSGDLPLRVGDSPYRTYTEAWHPIDEAKVKQFDEQQWIEIVHAWRNTTGIFTEEHG